MRCKGENSDALTGLNKLLVAFSLALVTASSACAAEMNSGNIDDLNGLKKLHVLLSFSSTKPLRRCH